MTNNYNYYGEWEGEKGYACFMYARRKMSHLTLFRKKKKFALHSTPVMIRSRDVRPHNKQFINCDELCLQIIKKESFTTVSNITYLDRTIDLYLLPR